jgi:hypothetical protein
MTDAEFRDEINEALRRHAGDLDAEDLREVASDLHDTADKWEASML